ncbi:MAG: hypothetical protein RIQ88_837, partial [Actinomycetota bacterium]
MSEKEQEQTGLAVIKADAVKDPGIEPHRVRMTDKSPKHEKAAA